MNEAHTNALGLADDDGDNVVSLEEFKNWVMANQSNVGGHTASMKEAVDEWGLTRLHYAARKGATRVVEKLLEEEYELVEGFVSGALKLTMDFRGGMSPKHRTAAKLLIPFSTLDNISVEFQRQAIQLFAETCGETEVRHMKQRGQRNGQNDEQQHLGLVEDGGGGAGKHDVYVTETMQDLQRTVSVLPFHELIFSVSTSVTAGLGVPWTPPNTIDLSHYSPPMGGLSWVQSLALALVRVTPTKLREMMTVASGRKKAWESRQARFDNFERQVAEIDAEMVDIEKREKADKALLDAKFTERTSLEAQEKKEEAKEAADQKAEDETKKGGMEAGGTASIEAQLAALDNLMDNLTQQKAVGHAKMEALTTKHRSLQSEILTLQTEVNARGEERHHRRFELTNTKELLQRKQAAATETKGLDEFQDTEINRALTGRAQYTDVEAEELGLRTIHGRPVAKSEPPVREYIMTSGSVCNNSVHTLKLCNSRLDGKAVGYVKDSLYIQCSEIFTLRIEHLHTET